MRKLIDAKRPSNNSNIVIESGQVNTGNSLQSMREFEGTYNQQLL